MLPNAGYDIDDNLNWLVCVAGVVDKRQKDALYIKQSNFS